MKKVFLFLLLLSVLLLACTSQSQVTPAATETEEPAQPTQTNSPSPTSTFTPQPTATPTEIPTNTPTPEPTSFAGGGGQIVFELNQVGLQDLYLIDSIGSTLTQLTVGADGERYFVGSWSPDGTQLLYRWFKNPMNALMIGSADGSESWTLTEEFDFANDWIWPSGTWSPDGQLLYVVIDYGREELKQEYRVYQLADKSFEQLDFYPHRWSPDGSKVLGYSVIDGNWEIYMMDTDGTNITNLTQNPAEDKLISERGETPWSPDGSQILFLSDREGRQQLFVMDADGTNPVNVSQEIAQIFEWLWSPDGEWIYFTSNRGGNRNVWRVRPNGEDKMQLTFLNGHEREMRISPNGQLLAFVSGDNFLPEGYVMDLETEEITKLVADNPQFFLLTLNWSADGNWLFALVNNTNNYGIYLISPDGTEVRELTLDQLPVHINLTGLPLWQP